MGNKMKRFNDLLDEGTLALSDEIFGLIDDELWENDLDPDLEAVLASEDIRKPARGR